MRVKDRGVIFDCAAAAPDEKSCAFTSLIRLANGDLLVGFRLGSGRDAPDGRVRVMRSRDEGRSWQILHAGLTHTIDGIEGNFYSGHFTELEPGHLLGAFCWVDRSDPNKSFVNPETTGLAPTRNLIAESFDDGETWGPYREVDCSPDTGCTVTGPVVKLAGGALAYPYESWKDYDDDSWGVHSAHFRISTDGGLTWPDDAVAATSDGVDIFYWDQRDATHPETGEIAIMYWTHDRTRQTDIENHIQFGSPDGRSWSAPISTGGRGQHCQPIALGGDRLGAVYVHRHDPPSIRFMISDDFGRTWDRENELTIFDSREGIESGHDTDERGFEDFWQDMMAWRFGHPRGVLLPDGDLFFAWYGGSAEVSTMEWALVGD